MFSFVVLCILGSNGSVYLKVLRDVLCEIQNLSDWSSDVCSSDLTERVEGVNYTAQ